MGREAMVEYRVTMICGGSLYCGPTVTMAGLKIATVYAFLAAYIAEFLAEPLTGEGPPGTGPPTDSGEGPPGAPPTPPEQPPISGPPVAGAP